MPQTFIVDQAATFSGLAFLESKPKLKFGSRDVQDTTSDGTPKWEVQLIGGFRDQFGQNAHEVIRVNIASHRDPGEGLGQYTPVHMIRFVVGVTPAEKRVDGQGREKITGGTVWYRADGIQSAMPGNTRQAKAEG
ncbi:hypothetical protein AB0G15_43450 [Streptosporangium sp. NPDC023825]|uniref:hypothetical protein n=1 Tax=Streptosporangium sp. NPDC023825 TaxID=3154909 RepID=UPI00343F44CB